MIPFPLGRLVAKPGALEAVAPDQPLALVRRHAAGDWGDLDARDTQANTDALKVGERQLSAYTVADRRV